MNNTKLNSKYVTPYTWQGTLTIDGGWGVKPTVEELASKVTIKTGNRFQLTPSIEFVDLKSAFGLVDRLDEAALPTANGSAEEAGYSYQVIFDGTVVEDVMELVSTLRRMAGVDILLDLITSLDPVGDAKYPCRMTIRCSPETQNKIEVNSIVGSWIPTFDNSIPLAGWVQELTEKVKK